MKRCNILQWVRSSILLLVVTLAPLYTGHASAAITDYQFSTGFSGTQGQNQWYYKQWDGSSYSDMTWYPANNYWRGNCQYCIISQEWQHPDSNDAVIAWQAPRSGTVTLRGIMDHRILNATADGVQTKIMKQNSGGLSQVWPSAGYQDILPNFSAQHIVKTTVSTGDMIYFHLNKKSANGYDTLYWNPRVSYDYEPKFTLDKAELVMNPTDFASIGEDQSVDVSMSIVGNGTNFDFYHSTTNGSNTEKFSGSLSAPATTPIYDKYPFTDTYSSSGEWWWIANTYKAANGDLLAFAHVENIRTGSLGWWAIGLAYSTDGGNTFTKLGKIITQNTPESPPAGQGGRANIFGVPYVIKDGYFYAYYGEPRAAVARAQVSDVLAAAQNGTVTSWNKYYNGGWSESALGGNFTPVVPDNTRYNNDFAVHGDAAYSSYANKYLLAGYTHSQGKGVFITFSDDGVHYEKPVWIQQSTLPGKGVLSPYITIVNEDGSDNGAVGQSFYVYYSYRFDGSASPSMSRWLYRQKVTLNQTGLDKNVYDASTDFGAEQGDNNWRYYQYDGSGYSDMGWDTTFSRWKGAHQYNIVAATWQHPDTYDSVRTWTAPKAGTVTVTAESGQVSVANGPGADGVRVKLLKGATNVWPSSGWQAVSAGSSATFSSTNITVSTGDTLYFVVNQNGNNAYDTTNWSPTITYQ